MSEDSIPLLITFAILFVIVFIVMIVDTDNDR
jgi:hypothetical protein